MIQPQNISLVPSLQANPARVAGSGGQHETRAGMFEDIMNPGGIQSRPKADITGRSPDAQRGCAAQNTAEKPLKPWPKVQPEEDPVTLYILTPIPPPPEPPLDFIPLDKPLWPLQILDTIVSILEGNNSNILINKEIVPLLAELKQALDLEEQPLPPELEEKLTEVMARTPQTEDIAETPRKLVQLTNFIATLRGYLCPPENVNEQQTEVDLPAEFASPAPAAVAATNGSEQTAQKESAFSQGQTKAKESDQTLPEGASFVIAPIRVSFAEHFSPAAQPVQPLTVENLFDTLIERIVSLPEAEPHMEISLKPDHLGKLVIDLRLADNGLSAKILTTDEGVRNLLAAHINRLSDTLAERGIRLENVEVVYTALSDRAFDRQQPGGEEARGSTLRKNTALRLAEPLSAAQLENIYGQPLYMDGFDWEVSSVEYRA